MPYWLTKLSIFYYLVCSTMQDPYKYLPGLGKFMLERAEEFSNESFRLLPGFNIPMIKALNHLSREELFAIYKAGNEKLFKSFTERNALQVGLASLDHFYMNQNPVLKTEDIEAEDFLLLYELREKTLLHFIPQYTSDLTIALGIIGEIRNFHSTMQVDSLKRFIEYKNYELRERNQLLSETQKQAQLGHWIYYFDTRKVTWSEMLYDILGFDKSVEVTHDTVLNMIDPEDKFKILRTTVEAIRKKKDRLVYNFSITTTTGFKKYISGIGHLVYSENSVPVALRGVFQDVTLSRAQYLLLEKSQYRLREAQHLAHIGSWEYFVNDGRTEWSEEHYLIFGLKPYEPITEEYFFKMIHPNDLENKVRLFKEVLATGKGYHEEYRIITPDGTTKWIRSYTKVRKDHVTGRILSLFGTSQDITETVTAYQKLKKSQERLSEAQHIARIGSWEFCFTTKEIEWTREHYQLFEITPPTKMTLKLWLSRVVDEDKEKLKAFLISSLERDVLYSVRFRVRSKLGHIKWFASTARLEQKERMEPERLYGTTQDITKLVEKEIELKALNESLEERVRERTKDLEESNENLQHFAYVVSHDLKAPLRAIANIVNFIENDFKDILDEQGREYLSILQDRTRFMERLIRDILEYSRAGEKKGEPEIVDLNLIVEKIMTDLDPNHIIHCEFDDLPKLMVRFTTIYQIFQNILGNAVKQIPSEGGKITIKYKSDPEKLIFSISDNGPGIDPQNYEKIFKIFETLNDDKAGSGVGLAIVKKLIKSLNGKVKVYSDPGKGATFDICLPATYLTE